MATNPQNSPYKTQRFSFIGSPQQRDGTFLKDQRFLNMYPELIKSPISDGKKYYLKKRPGTQIFQPLGAGEGRAIFNWNVTGAHYTCLGNIVYKDLVPIIALTTSTGVVGIIEYRVGGNDELFICDGTKGYTISTADVVTIISDPNFPSPHLPYPIYLDGYVFLAPAGGQTIRNSNLGDPLTWPTDGFIDAEMYPDNITQLSKQQNYLVAIGESSIEFFYDNANATGSPLQRNAPAVAQFGCVAPKTVSQTEKELILVGTTDNGGRTVWVIDGFQPTEIANEPVREALDLEGESIPSATGFNIQCAGHKWYVLNLALNQRTFVYDFEEQMWHEWSSGLTQAKFQYDFAANSALGIPALLSIAGGPSVLMSSGVYTDSGSTIAATVVTSKIDFDTIDRKRIYRLSLITDSPNGTTPVPMRVTWSDDDYNTWVPTAGAGLFLNATYPTITQLGYTRRRAFKFEFQQNLPLRMEAFEVDIIQESRR